MDNLPSLSILVGPNNSGKSAVLHAISLPKYGLRWDPELPTAPVDDRTVIRSPISVVDLDFGGQDGQIRIGFGTLGNGQIQTELVRGGRHSTGNAQIPAAATRMGAQTLPGVRLDDQHVFFLGAYRAVPQRSFQYQRFDRDIGPSGDGCWNALHNLKADDNPTFAQIQTVMSELGFQVRSVRTPTADAGEGSIRLENYGRSDSLPFIGSGADSVLPVITQGTLCEGGETFLVEEPELHLHESAVNGLGRFLARLTQRGVQVMMTTHSTSLFGPLYLGIEEGITPRDAAVFVFDRAPTGGTSVSRVSLEDYYRARHTAEQALRRPTADVPS
jgi:predicted ATPase